MPGRPIDGRAEPGVWLIRHAATTAPPGIAIGSGDPPLSPAGRARARALAAELAGRSLAAVFASDRRRALDTARAIAAPHRLQVGVDARLRELDFGAWEGRRLADLWVEEPEAAAAWEGDVRATPPSFGESLEELRRRVGAFAGTALPGRDGEVAVVAHRGSLAVLRAILTGESLESALAAELPLGTAARVAIMSGSI
jgi:broad specificity phosphatase PhoE